LRPSFPFRAPRRDGTLRAGLPDTPTPISPVLLGAPALPAKPARPPPPARLWVVLAVGEPVIARGRRRGGVTARTGHRDLGA
jgi:hypothetical protein